MGALHGSASWERFMGALHGSASWERFMGTLHGNASWERFMGAPLQNGVVTAGNNETTPLHLDSFLGEFTKSQISETNHGLD